MTLASLAGLLLLQHEPAFGDRAEADHWADAVFSDGLVDADGKKVPLDVLEDKIVGIYFSASWCGPCRVFTPRLIDYRKRNSSNFEVVFVSSDRSEADQHRYMKAMGMDWPALKWGSSSAQALQSKYAVNAIPRLLLFSGRGELLSTEGRQLVGQNVDAEKLQFAKIVNEQYRCGRCNKAHVRKKLVFTEN